MCGIAGAVNFKLSPDDLIRTMGHRGPDANGRFESGNVDLFHLRLSILDIGSGMQPMTLDNRFTIVFNGEIYNHSELRNQFQLKGSTHSDTETLLLLFRDMGSDMLQYLDGMFAFAIYDSEEQLLFLARDRAGKKPLYIYNEAGRFVFASELNGLRSMLPLEINPGHFHAYLRFGTFYRRQTPYKHVEDFPAGSWMEVDCKQLSVKEQRWWDISDHYAKHHHLTDDEALMQTEKLLHTAIKRRLESSDLEVGCFLSGGIDSGLVTAIASEYNKSLKTFTVSFKGEFDESPLARLVSKRYGTAHTEIGISFDRLKEDVESIIANYGEPYYDSSAIPSYYVSREAKKHLTVILTGDGADELFGGYRRYVPFARYDFFRPNRILQALAASAYGFLPVPDNKKSSYNYIHRLAGLASKKGPDVFTAAASDIFDGYEDCFINCSPAYLDSYFADFRRIASGNKSGLAKIMHLDFDITLFSDFLVKMDIATMANSLEGRSPFLSKEILAFAPGLKDDQKVRGRVTKFLLRKMAEKYLPGELVNQPKRGFEIPLKRWVNNELKELISDYLISSGSFCHGLVDRKFTEGLLSGGIKIPREKAAKMTWTLFCMEVWYRKVFIK